MIQTFSDKVTAALFTGCYVRRFPKSIQRAALRKLLMIDAATCVEDLLVPPGNRLEGLHGKPVDLWSIRVNQQWRVCFRFAKGDAYDVGIVDYH
ncbi:MULTISPECIES: type II toxin-antitoxin system RelE/ParE family toxin [unclassified Pandoraea]|uniref:type II toxin-antitoxin system RelE/ParE family toxin n=1 Tax=unclassified Pandoraea TaxID=2624094 RepID=UPI000B3F9CD1|nr:MULTISPECIES: type II toxin-antitoxin system RelE/ParE family toxin [unclassified Pandoraea]